VGEKVRSDTLTSILTQFIRMPSIVEETENSNKSDKFNLTRQTITSSKQLGQGVVVVVRGLDDQV